MMQSKPGYVYVATTTALPGLVKIGFTTQSPQKRIKQFSTGAPMPFKLNYATEVSDPRRIEQLVHSHLTNYRVHDRREFFRVTPQEAHQAIRDVSEEVRYREDLGRARKELRDTAVWFIKDFGFLPKFVRPIASILVLPFIISVLVISSVAEFIWITEGFGSINETIRKFEASHLLGIAIFPLWIPMILFLVVTGKLIDLLDFPTNRKELEQLQLELVKRHRLSSQHLSIPLLF